MSGAHRLSVRVYWEDTDASGVVYHANYLRWAERGRSEWLRDQGGTQQQWIEEQGVAFTVAELSVRYRRPARLDDLLDVVTKVETIRRASLVFHQQVIHLARQEILATLSVKAGSVSLKSFRPIPLPSWFLRQNSE
jgi:acyl-CoA thioester hydrolase